LNPLVTAGVGSHLIADGGRAVGEMVGPDFGSVSAGNGAVVSVYPRVTKPLAWGDRQRHGPWAFHLTRQETVRELD
jgi:hypothetical protein